MYSSVCELSTHPEWGELKQVTSQLALDRSGHVPDRLKDGVLEESAGDLVRASGAKSIEELSDFFSTFSRSECDEDVILLRLARIGLDVVALDVALGDVQERVLGVFAFLLHVRVGGEMDVR